MRWRFDFSRPRSRYGIPRAIRLRSNLGSRSCASLSIPATGGFFAAFWPFRKPGHFHVIRFEDGQSDQLNRYVPHRHDCFEIIWRRSARGQVRSDLRSYRVADHTLFFTSPGQIHAWEIAHNAEGKIASCSEEFFSANSAHPGLFGKMPFLSVAITRVLFRLETLQRGPRFNQRRIDRKMPVGHPCAMLRERHHLRSEPVRHLVRRQPFLVLRERRVIEARLVGVQVQKPAEEQIVWQAVRGTAAPNKSRRAPSIPSPGATAPAGSTATRSPRKSRQSGRLSAPALRSAGA